MKYLYLILALLVCSSADAGQYHSRGRVDSFFSRGPTVYARSYYANPYYTANPNYLPKPIGWEEFTNNKFYSKDAPLAKPPRGLLEILTPGTYTIKQPEPEAYGPPPTIGK